MRLMFLLLIAMLALAGCGKKGDLYLPGNTPATPTQPSPQ